jgi:serpin B
VKLIILAAAVVALALLPALALAQETSSVPAPNAPCDPKATSAKLTPEAHDAVAGINAFSLDLYKRTLTSGDNLFLSPASVSTAVALAYRGSVGKTADELRRVLRFNAPPDAYFPASAGVFASMNFCGPSRVLQTANAIWVQDDIPLKPDYVADVQRYMGVGLQRTDFRANPEKSRSDINAWAATATHDRITGLLQQGDVTDDTRAVLVNAIYWKGRWDSTFDASGTRTEPFTQLDGEVQPTPLMHQRADFAVVERSGVQAIELPYVGHEVSMVVFLPRSSHALPKFEAGLTDQELKDWFDALDAARLSETILTLPKVHLEDRCELEETLKKMGAPKAFGDDADFSGMETAVADKPFLFVLRDRRTGLILFMGRYVAPPRQ